MSKIKIQKVQKSNKYNLILNTNIILRIINIYYLIKEFLNKNNELNLLKLKFDI